MSRINHTFKRKFKYLDSGEVSTTGFVDPLTGSVRWVGQRGISVGEVPTTGTYVAMHCNDGNEYYEFTPYQS